MKHILFLTLTTLLLSSCTTMYYSSGGPEDDDIYYDPSTVYPTQNDDYTEYTEEPRSDDYWDESYADEPLTENGDVYIENYYDGYVWNDPFASSRFAWNYPWRTSFALYYSNYGMFYDPWFGWQVGFNWGWRPLRPWGCSVWDPFWGNNWGWGYTCNPWAYPFNPYWNTWGYYGGGPGFWLADNTTGNGQGYVYGHRPSISTGSSVNSGYTGNGNYTVDRHYAATKPLSSGSSNDLSRPSKPVSENVSRPLIERPDVTPSRDVNARPDSRPASDPNRPVYDTRPSQNDQRSPRNPSTQPQPDRRPSTQPQPDRRPSTQPSRPSRDRNPDRPSRDGGGGSMSPSRTSPSSPSRGGGGSGGGRRGGLSFQSRQDTFNSAYRPSSGTSPAVGSARPSTRSSSASSGSSRAKSSRSGSGTSRRK